MAISRQILKRLNEKTLGDKTTKQIIIELLEFESEQKKWYKDTYNNVVKKYSNDGE